MVEERRRTHGPVRIKDYGPLAGIMVAFLAVVILVPPLSTPSPTIAAGSPDPTQAIASRTGPDHPASGDGAPCPDRKAQIEGDPYSPPCIAFSGDNGGATATGVTATDITISYRRQDVGDLLSLLTSAAKGSGAAANTPEDIERTESALVEYFNRHFQLYGRRMVLSPYKGTGNLISELLGGGQQGAQADAKSAAGDLHAFADITGVSQPYNEELAKRNVVAIGAPYLSDDYFTQHAPYAWSDSPSCTSVVTALVDLADKSLMRDSATAKWAGGDLKGRPRKVAFLRPDNGEYRRCGDAGVEALHAKGYEVTAIEYQLNLTTMQSQAASVISKLKAGEFTSVACGCDPQFPVYLSAKAKDQGYAPEWLVTGTALTDTDEIGALYDQTEWSHAFGASVLGAPLPLKETQAYKAFKEIRPNEEPVSVVPTIYNQVLILALGLQLAGPTLTADNFAAGLSTYRGHSGEAGSWSFAGGHHTPQQDAQLIWWDPDAISPATGDKGAYVRSGDRFAIGQFPSGEPKLFTK